jgi:hypothetical protein
VEDEIDAERAVCELPDLADHLLDGRNISPGDREHPQPTCVGDGSNQSRARCVPDRSLNNGEFNPK